MTMPADDTQAVHLYDQAVADADRVLDGLIDAYLRRVESDGDVNTFYAAIHHTAPTQHDRLAGLFVCAIRRLATMGGRTG